MGGMMKRMYNLYTAVLFLNNKFPDIHYQVAAYTVEDAYFQVEKFAVETLKKQGYLVDSVPKIINIYPRNSDLEHQRRYNEGL
jgi:hypothetical protein